MKTGNRFVGMSGIIEVINCAFSDYRDYDYYAADRVSDKEVKRDSIENGSRIITLPGVCSFFPDQLLEIYLDMKAPGLVEVGGRVMTTAAVILPVYVLECLILLINKKGCRCLSTKRHSSRMEPPRMKAAPTA